jgi:hypothetical protein
MQSLAITSMTLQHLSDRNNEFRGQYTHLAHPFDFLQTATGPLPRFLQIMQ